MHLLTYALLALVLGIAPAASAEKEGTLYKTPQCGCCEGHANYLRSHGIRIRTVETHDLPLLRREHRIPEDLEGCHLILLDGYVIEGHIPITPIQRLLRERPAIRGISLPGMPAGSPGMSGPKTEPFTIYEISDGDRRVFAVE